MEIVIVCLLIFIGILLLFIEFFVLPGITIAGIGGILFMIGAVWYGYESLSDVGANIVLGSTIILFGGSLTYALRFKTWDKMALKTNVDSKVDVLLDMEVATGDKGVALSRLAPMGKVSINGNIMEAKSIIGLIDENTPIEVVSVKRSQVIVKRLNN